MLAPPLLADGQSAGGRKRKRATASCARAVGAPDAECAPRRLVHGGAAPRATSSSTSARTPPCSRRVLERDPAAQGVADQDRRRVRRDRRAAPRGRPRRRRRLSVVGEVGVAVTAEVERHHVEPRRPAPRPAAPTSGRWRLHRGAARRRRAGSPRCSACSSTPSSSGRVKRRLRSVIAASLAVPTRILRRCPTSSSTTTTAHRSPRRSVSSSVTSASPGAR